MASTTTCADSALAIAADVFGFITFALAVLGYIIAYIATVYHAPEEVERFRNTFEVVSIQLDQAIAAHDQLGPSPSLQQNQGELYALLEASYEQVGKLIQAQKEGVDEFINVCKTLEAQLRSSQWRRVWYRIRNRAEVLAATRDLLRASQDQHDLNLFELMGKQNEVEFESLRLKLNEIAAVH